MSSCVYIPTIIKNGQEQPSRLFQDLSKIFKKREDAIDVWSLFQIPNIEKYYNISKVDGEFLLEDVVEALHLNNLEDKLTKSFLFKEFNLLDKDGNIKTFKKFSDVFNACENFNNEHSKVKIIPVKTKNGYTIDLANSIDSDKAIEDLHFKNELNHKLLTILHELGFDVKIIEGLNENGIFDPLNAEANAEGLIQIIKLAKGIRGEKALPEEFSHMLVAGLRHQPLIRRALENLSMDDVKSKLGDEFEEYNRKYNGNEQLLKEEALGKMIAEYLQNKPENNGSLFNRIWNFIKSLFSKLTERDINNAVNEARKAAQRIASDILNDTLDFSKLDKSEILSSKTSYQIDNTTKNIKDYAELVRKKYALLAKDISSMTNEGVLNDTQKETLKNLNKQLENGKYVEGCATFLNTVLADAKHFQEQLIHYKNLSKDDIEQQLFVVCSIVNGIKDFINTYDSIIKELAAFDLTYAEVGISQEDGENIANLAKQVKDISNSVEELMKNLTFKAMILFLQPYWKTKEINTGFIENQVITVETLLEKGFNDISFADSTVNAIVESNDILLSLMAKIAIHQQDLRDARLLEDDRYIREAEQKLRESGVTDTSFMYDKDENGKPTGWLISDRNSVAYEKAKQKYKEILDKDKQLSIKEKIERLQSWENNNTEVITVVYNNKPINIRVPNLKYKYSDAQNPLNKLTKAQKEYYDSMMALKAERELAIPEYKRNLYKAVQKRTDVVESLASNVSDSKQLFKKCIEKVKDNFIKRVDDTEFGSVEERNGQLVLLNAQGKPIKKIPVFYLNDLEDMSELSMDFGGSMRAYTATLTNYEMMNQILPQMRLLNETIQNRKVTIRNGRKIKKSVKKVLGVEYEEQETKQGKDLKIGKAADFLMDKMFYGINKIDEGTIGNTNIDVAKFMDFIKSYTSVVGMGLNLYSGISNITMGGMQSLIEAVGGENFNFKDLAKAHVLYDKDILGCISEVYAVKRENKLSLLMDKFDSLESFYDNIKNKAFYKNGTMRAVKELNLMIFNEIGEHRLHNLTMLAILNHTKVKFNDKEMSLYDALEVSKEEIIDGKKESVSAYLKLKDGVTKLDGTEFTQDDFIKIKRQISRTNRRLHGAYSESFKGAVHQKALGRLALQFRQWMPAFYNNRFGGMFNGGSYYDVELEDTEEGYYVTLFKFSMSALKAIKDMKFEFATNWNNLTPHQKANMKKSVFEICSFAVLTMLCGLLGSFKDKDSIWAEKMLYYQCLRLRLEVGAGMPFHPDFFDNIWTMLQSPAASIKSLNNVTDLLKFWNLWIEIQTGRYKGWSRYHKDFVECIPLYGQVRKVFDLKGEDYMFNIFNTY